MDWSMVDGVYSITQADKDEVLGRYFSPDNRLMIKDFPAQEKKKVIILQKIVGDFAADVQYSEREVNAILKRYYDDYAIVRRYLVSYGWLNRSGDGAVYRLNSRAA